jgi:hypothetical protein
MVNPRQSGLTGRERSSGLVKQKVALKEENENTKMQSLYRHTDLQRILFQLCSEADCVLEE